MGKSLGTRQTSSKEYRSDGGRVVRFLKIVLKLELKSLLLAIDDCSFVPGVNNLLKGFIKLDYNSMVFRWRVAGCVWLMVGWLTESLYRIAMSSCLDH